MTPPASEPKKVAIITGASQGIGAGLVEAYRRAGYAVVGTSRSISSSDEPGFLTVQGDITQVDSAQRVVDEATGRFGRIDSLINNAGLFIAKPFDEYTPDDFAAVTAVNLAGFFHITQRAVRTMLLQGNGHIVNISTSLVDHANSHAVAALATLTKGGLAAVTRSLAIEYASRGVRVNAVSLGVIKTPTYGPESYEAIAAMHPIGRAGEISDVVETQFGLHLIKCIDKKAARPVPFDEAKPRIDMMLKQRQLSAELQNRLQKSRDAAIIVRSYEKEKGA